MKLAFLEICGFRGFKKKVRLEFGSGFTVICGRNGVGKSTIFDAVEFALTGRIDKYATEKSALETLSDYIWWRGDGVPENHYVTLGFVDNLRSFSVTRTRETGPDKTDAEIRVALCNPGLPEDALMQLCKTSIIRDEWIAAQSMDLTDTERFNLVRSALGPIEGIDYGTKAKSVVASAEENSDRTETAYDDACSQLNSCLVQLAEARDATTRVSDIDASMGIVAAETGSTGDLANQLSAARAKAADRRIRLAALGEAVHRAREIMRLRQDQNSDEVAKARAETLKRLSDADSTKVESEKALLQAHRLLEFQEQSSSLAASLATMIEHGEKIGLHDDRCPLCAAARTSREFSDGLLAAKERAQSLSAGIVEARVAYSLAQELFNAAEMDHSRAAAAWEQYLRRDEDLRLREQQHLELCREHSLDAVLATDPDGLEKALGAERESLLKLERALHTVEISQSGNRVASLENRVKSLRELVDSTADKLTRAQTAVTTAKAIERAVRRVSGEIIDERLAQISPLLNELYYRLRPHSDWRTIEYSIRGDVRRLLSLKVGNGLNPQFVFSSGQRRAAGLAFLLSVYLSRAWTRWNSLLLDDPVQHIDDFRALQLAEVLSALRAGGRQIVCAVEDTALADLLCRRLVGRSDEVGRRYDIGIDDDGNAHVVRDVEIPPMPQEVLRRLTELRVAG